MTRPFRRGRHAAASSFLLNPTYRQRFPRKFYEDFSSCLPPHRPPTTAVVGELATVGLSWNLIETTAKLESRDDQRLTKMETAQPDRPKLHSSCHGERLIRRQVFVALESVVVHRLVVRSFRRCCEVQPTLVGSHQLD